MKISGGALKGRAIPGRVAAGVRPTASRVREALFSMLGQDLSGLTVLDAFAGSGLLSIEALSRGAERALLIEANKATARGIRAALAALDLSDRAELRVGRSPTAWPDDRRFDLIFLDPPYALDPGPLLQACVGVCAGQVALECASSRQVMTPEGLELLRERRYGDSALRLYAGLGR